MASTSLSWRTKSIAEILHHFKSSHHGLSAAQVVANSITYQGIRLPEKPRALVLLIFLAQFKSPLVYLLLLASGFSLLAKEPSDVITILVVLLINALVGTIFELRTRNLTNQLHQKLQTSFLVKRGGKVLAVPPHKLTYGDYLIIRAGDKIPGDCRLVKNNFLEVDESSLTGESLPVAKDSDWKSIVTNLAEQKHMLFEGTTVVNGSGEAIIIALGEETIFGNLNQVSQSEKTPTSPFLKRVQAINTLVAIAALVLSAIILISLSIQGQNLLDSIKISIALVVAVVPEGLPILLTLTLLLGVFELAQEHAIVKNLAAVDTLAHTTVLVSDKTGTLTENQLVAKQIILPQADGISRADIEAKTAFISGVTELVSSIILTEEGQAISHLANYQDPLEIALRNVSNTLRSDLVGSLKDEEPEKVIPFSSEYKFMAIAYSSSKQDYKFYLKGAWEILLKASNYCIVDGKEVELSDKVQNQLLKIAEEEQAKGHKIILFAQKTTSKHHVKANLAETINLLKQNLTLVGLVIIQDPLRADALETITALKKLGVEIKIASGDHIQTTKAIAHELHLSTKDLSGAETIENISYSKLHKTSIFARVSPLDKLNLVKRLQHQGNVVAMTGDGSNDAPALKQADVGIALPGQSEIAKERADIVLTNGSLATILHAFQSGKILTRNIQRMTAFLVVTNGVEALVITLATILSGHASFLLPTQVLWLNLLSDTPLAIPFAFEKYNNKNSNLKTNKHLPTQELIFFSIGAVTMTITTLLLNFSLQTTNLSQPVIQTAVIHSLIAGQIFLLLATHRGELMLHVKGQRNVSVLFSIVSVFAILGLTFILPSFQHLTQLVALPFNILVLVWGSNLGVLVVIELLKFSRLGLQKA